MNTFQIISIVVFIIIAVVAVLVFAGILPGFRGGSGGGAGKITLSLWGVFPRDTINRFIAEFQKENKSFDIKYTQKQALTFETELINALAAGNGPDLWLLPQNLILKHKNKLQTISFENVSERDFRNVFIDGSELYLDSNNQNIIAFPFIIDPLVMYYNKDLFRNAGLTQPPETWDQFMTTSQILTVKDEVGNIKQAGSALGEYSNVLYARDILAALIFQAGDPIVDRTKTKVVLGERRGEIMGAAESALRFYTEFSNPKKISYTWNKFLEPSKELFLKGKLAMYFGYASELEDIKEKNPHLNFDVAQFPQVLDGNIKATFGRMWGLAISNQAKNKQGAFLAVKSLVSRDSLEALIKALFLPPVRKDMLNQKPADPYMSIFYKAAVWSMAWLDPDPERSSPIFKNMIEAVARGERNEAQAVADANKQLTAIMPQ